MGLIFILVVSAAVPGSQDPRPEPDWTRIWTLCQLVRGDVGVRDELAQLSFAARPGVRREVAIHHLETSLGKAPALVPCEEMPELGPGGSWAFSLAIQPGPVLDLALIGALKEVPPGALAPVNQRAYERFIEHSTLSAGPKALKLAEALHGRTGAIWSGLNLAISRTRVGEYESAAKLIIGLLGGDLSHADRVMLKSRLTLVYLGSGGLLYARSALGAGLVSGSGDSGIVLGLLALERRHWDRSRALFRSTLARDPMQVWAGRGWGLSMVPRPEPIAE